MFFLSFSINTRFFSDAIEGSRTRAPPATAKNLHTLRPLVSFDPDGMETTLAASVVKRVSSKPTSQELTSFYWSGSNALHELLLNEVFDTRSDL